MTKNKLSFWNRYSLICTFFGIGKIPFAPGTFGSLAAYPVYFLYYLFSILVLAELSDSIYFIASPIPLDIQCFIIFTLILFISGTISSSRYMKLTGRKDPKEIVIDEVLGQMLVLYFTLPISTSINSKFWWVNLFFTLVAPFLFFRFFDIVKPWPINWFDKNIKGGLGVMIDDIVAAFFAVIVLNWVMLTLIDKQLV